MAVPKCKVSKARRDQRRGSNWKLSAPSVTVCSKCGEPVMPHRACKATTTAVRFCRPRLTKAGKERKREEGTLPSSFSFL